MGVGFPRLFRGEALGRRFEIDVTACWGPFF